MMVCFMAALMMVPVGCQKDDIAPNGVLPGLFSVSETQQVHFSKGNLQYKASTNTWRFAEHQYDYEGAANSNISSTYSGWIDLFGWGTSGWNSGAVCYQPWSTSTLGSDYHPGGSDTNGLTGAYAEADWAWHNAIRNGCNVAHKWRTLTSSEWDYLLHIRPNASAKHGSGNIDGVGGLIILPDSWTLPSRCSFTAGLPTYDENNDPNWTRNSYTLAEWAQMEAAGAVFLPAAGFRTVTKVKRVGSYGYYWSPQPCFEPYSASIMFLSSNMSGPEACSHRGIGNSVRPVLDEK